jgi:transposase
VIAWHILSTGEAYTDLGADYFHKHRNSAARQRRLVAQLEAMGHHVTLEPAA